MPYQQGSASGYLDLLNKLCTFISSSEMGVQAWTVQNNTTSSFTANGEVYLKGPGLNGNDSVYVNIQTYSVPASGIYQWVLQGAVGFGSDLGYAAQPGCIPSALVSPRLPLQNTGMSYTFIANGRRFVVIVYCGTVVESCYCGFITQYGPSTRWDSPMFIGGMSCSASVIPSTTTTENTWWLRNFSTENYTTTPSQAYLRDVSGTWRRGRAYTTYGFTVGYSTPVFCVWPQAAMQNNNLIAQCIGGSYQITQSEVVTNESGEHAVVGKLDGVCWLTGYNENGSLSSGDTIASNGVTYYVFSNAYRTGVDDFSAVALE